MSRSPKWFAAKMGRRDIPHAAIAKGLRKLGHLVADCAGSRKVLDLCVWPRVFHYDDQAPSSRPIWLEVKRADGKGELTKLQREFVRELERHGVAWAAVTSLDEALRALND